MMHGCIDELVARLQAVAGTGEGKRGRCLRALTTSPMLWWPPLRQQASAAFRQPVQRASRPPAACAPSSRLLSGPPLPAGVNVSEMLKEMSLDVIGITAFGWVPQKLQCMLVSGNEKFQPCRGPTATGCAVVEVQAAGACTAAYASCGAVCRACCRQQQRSPCHTVQHLAGTKGLAGGSWRRWLVQWNAGPLCCLGNVPSVLSMLSVMSSSAPQGGLQGAA